VERGFNGAGFHEDLIHMSWINNDFFIVTQWGHNQQPILRDGNHQSISMEIKNNNYLTATMGTLCFRLVVIIVVRWRCCFQKV